MEKYRSYINNLIKEDLLYNPNLKLGKINEATSYALTGGKNLRSIIVLTICDRLNEISGSILKADRAALSIEYIHNASLIIDDMPMMDNDTMRRGCPTVHHKFGERVAQLVSYNLIITSIKHLFENLELFKKSNYFGKNREHDEELHKIRDLMSTTFFEKLSLNGLCGGQYLDLHIQTEFAESEKENDKAERIIDMIEKKTACLFELAFMMGWIFGGGNVDKVPDLIEIGRSFGIAFQIVDDLEDYEGDLKKGYKNNICEYYARDQIHTLFHEHMDLVKEELEELDIFTPVLAEIHEYLMKKFL